MHCSSEAIGHIATLLSSYQRQLFRNSGYVFYLNTTRSGQI